MHPALLMFIAARHVEQRVLAALREAGHDLTLAQARLLARVPEDGIRLTQLAESAQVTKQTAGFLVDQVEKAGYVERVPDPTDARARLVMVGPRGRQAQKVARTIERRIEREWAEHLGPDRLRLVTDALSDLRQITDPFL